MSMLATGLLLWVVVHLFPSLLPEQRQKLISRIGDKAYQGIFALCILVGSVHLGWHYAVDGYIGAAIAAAIWFGVGAVQRLLPGQGEETTST